MAKRVSFQVADALQQPFADGSFDLVWSLESGEHMCGPAARNISRHFAHASAHRCAYQSLSIHGALMHSYTQCRARMLHPV